MIFCFRVDQVSENHEGKMMRLSKELWNLIVVVAGRTDGSRGLIFLLGKEQRMFAGRLVISYARFLESCNRN
jgi:hypothetical protein